MEKMQENSRGRKVITVAHHVDDYECMWNGIEDLYMTQTGEEFPPFFFFSVAGSGNFMYMKSNKGPVKRQAVWNDGRTQKMYERMKDIVGFSYKYIEGRSFTYTLGRAKQEIDAGYPVILGMLDMYYLSYYPKFYYKEHMPIHYVMMVGYDDEKECVVVRDCGIDGEQLLAYDILEKALDVENGGMSKKNTICLIRLDERPKSVIEIASEGFRKKAELMLAPPISSIGIPGMRKLAREFGDWGRILSPEDYEASLRWLVTFSGTVPSLPMRLIGKEETIRHQAGREKLSVVLKTLSKAYNISSWKKAATYFEESGRVIESITEEIVERLLHEREELKDIPQWIEKMADLEAAAFKALLL